VKQQILPDWARFLAQGQPEGKTRCQQEPRYGQHEGVAEPDRSGTWAGLKPAPAAFHHAARIMTAWFRRGEPRSPWAAVNRSVYLWHER
jgi:hypothetical protein